MKKINMQSPLKLSSIPLITVIIGAVMGLFGCGSTGISPGDSILISSATIVDGTGSPSYEGDILIEGERIIRIAEANTISPAPGTTVINADGLTVSPGFIDVHSHDDLSLLQHPEQLPKVMMH